MQYTLHPHYCKIADVNKHSVIIGSHSTSMFKKSLPYLWLCFIDAPCIAVLFTAWPMFVFMHAVIVWIALLINKVHVSLSLAFLILLSSYYCCFDINYDSGEWRIIAFATLVPIWTASLIGYAIRASELKKQQKNEERS